MKSRELPCMRTLPPQKVFSEVDEATLIKVFQEMMKEEKELEEKWLIENEGIPTYEVELDERSR